MSDETYEDLEKAIDRIGDDPNDDIPLDSRLLFNIQQILLFIAKRIDNLDTKPPDKKPSQSPSNIRPLTHDGGNPFPRGAA